MPKTCPVCGKIILEKQTYCSLECKSKCQTNKIELVCKGCGIHFKILPYLQRKSNYCSPDCYHNSTRKKVTKSCLVCGEKFTVKRYLDILGFGLYCSRNCREKTYELKRVLQICSTCGKTFKRPQSLSNKYKNVFCSKKCHDDSRRDYVSISCQNCHKTITIPRSITNRDKGRFCSWYCYTHFKGETSIEKLVKNKLKKVGISFRQEVKIGKYHADFMIGNSNILIECDGDYWHSLPQAIIKDKNRDAILQRKGFQTIRFTETEIKKTKGSCVVSYLSNKCLC